MRVHSQPLPDCPSLSHCMASSDSHTGTSRERPLAPELVAKGCEVDSNPGEEIPVLYEKTPSNQEVP